MTSSDQPIDHAAPPGSSGEKRDRSDLENNIATRATWVRLGFMIVIVILYAISRILTFTVVIVQFFTVLFTGDTNARLKSLGHSLAIYSFQVVDYLTFNSQMKPFPFDAEWPDELPRSKPADGAENSA